MAVYVGTTREAAYVDGSGLREHVPALHVRVPDIDRNQNVVEIGKA